MSKFNEHRKILDDLRKYEAKIPVIVTKMGNIGKNHSVQSFRDQGFTDSSFEKWQRRKNKDSRRGRKNGGVRSVKNRAILVKSGALRRSIEQRKKGKWSVELVSNLPYANIHNEGQQVNVSSRSGSGTITARVRGNSGFVNGKFTRGRSKKIKLQGAGYTTGAYSFKMPKRQFVGYSSRMSMKIEKMIEREIKSI